MSKQIIIDGTLIEVADGTTILQACEQTGVEIPRFCYHERLSIAGNCRMCLVEVVGIGKPIASCAMGVGDLPPNRDGSPREVSTKSPLVKHAREGVMEFLLINHPLDCPICDQGGECDLQDQAMAFGFGGSRFVENKRAVEEKYIGPLIKTFMNRCIHCTRCVRFMTEIAGVEELGAIGRGEDMEITTYLEHGILTEMSANVNDLCPVGALTHRPWSYMARSWEFEKTESFDVMDAVGSAIRVDTRGREVMRILPRNNDDVNEEWISDKTRHVCDGLRTQRLDRPYVREDGKLRPASWAEALAAAAAKLKEAKPERIGAIVGDLAGAEEMFALKELMTSLDVKNIDCRQDGAKLAPSLGRASYLFNTTIAGIEQADALLLIGTNPRLEATVLNARILKRWRTGGLKVGVIGEKALLTYPYDYLGSGAKTLGKVAEGPHAFAKVLKDAERPMVIIGAGAYARPDGAALLGLSGDPRSLWFGPDRWLLVSDSKSADSMVEECEKSLADVLHNAVDYSAGLAVYRLTGTGARDLLAAGCGLDFRDEKFQVGTCCRTRFAQIAAVIVAEGPEQFEIYVDRSYEKYLSDWLRDSQTLSGP